MPEARLEVTDAFGQRTVTIDKTSFAIGRRDTNDLRLAGSEVSRDHAEISFEAGRFVIRDRGSRYGSFVNGDQVTERDLTGEIAEHLAATRPQRQRTPCPGTIDVQGDKVPPRCGLSLIGCLGDLSAPGQDPACPVDPAADEPREQPQGYAEEDREQHRQDDDLEGGARPPDHARPGGTQLDGDAQFQSGQADGYFQYPQG